MAGLLNIGLTGLNAAQAQLITTGHNITNAGVDGYHRQTVIQRNATPQFTGEGFFGQGTQVASVTRSYDRFLETQVLTSSTRQAEYATYSSQISQINNLLADSTSGLSPSLEAFFAGVQEVAANPTSVAARQSLLSAAESMTARFQALDSRFSEIRDSVEGQIESTVGQINMYASAIADMNDRISLAQVAGSSVAANDLLDQREQLISELNKLVKVTAVTESNGMTSVFIGTGQSLVTGNQTTTLGAVQDVNDPQRKVVALISANGTSNALPESLLSGGALGGLLSFRSGTLDTAQNSLGLIAMGVAQTFNDQHALGIDLNGKLGGAFFNISEPTLKPAIGGVSVFIDDVSELSANDYLLEVDGSGYKLTIGDKEVSFSGTSYQGEGLNISITSASQIPATGLFIQPVRFAARDISVAITDPREVAVGDPVSVAPGSFNGAASDRIQNVKTTAVGVGGIDANSDGTADFSPITLTFNSGTNTFTATSGTIERYAESTGSWVSGSGFNPATDSTGVKFRVVNGTSPADYAFEFTAIGAWQDGESMVFSPTAAGVADNRNAVALGALQTSKTMLSDGSTSTATFQSVYAQMVSKVGNKAREVQVGEKAQASLLAQATDARDSVSGVNLDEEAANLVRYQMAYQSAAKVMTVAQTLFDTVLSIGR